MSTPLMPGAEPVSIAEGTRGGVLLLHGYTATPQQLRNWAMAFARAGFAVEVPLLPGHGTLAEELAETSWSDYVDCADAFYKKLAARHQQIFVGGLCTGGNIAAWMAIRYPATTAGLMVINGHFKNKAPRGGTVDSLRELLKTGKRFFEWPTLPKQVEDPQAPPILAYNKIPIAPMLSLGPARIELCQHLGEIFCPVLVFVSLLGSDADPDNRWFENVSGPAERIVLERSNHVATLDYDKEVVFERSLAFALAISEARHEQSPKDIAYSQAQGF
ncbi:MAG TPA: alpha/beta fold hydrolase [Ktedonobacteraceae bacterium]|nr:alpha/beta fold hydrolase [Ktedonobacteraceae bacterium]